MQIEEERWDANITLALKSVYLVTRTCLPHLLAAGHGSAIVNISSVNGQTGLGEEAYAAAKAGVINLTQVNHTPILDVMITGAKQSGRILLFVMDPKVFVATASLPAPSKLSYGASV